MQEFSQNWRRRRACDRCRRYKVRCIWETTSTDICSRCQKAGHLCEVTEQAPKIYRKRKRRDPNSEEYASWENRPVVTRAEKEKKLEQLQGIMSEVSTESTRLRQQLDPIPKAGPHVAGEPRKVTLSEGKDLIEQISRNNDCCNAVVTTGLMSKETITQCYNVFLRQMSLYVPFGIDVTVSYEEMAAQSPVLTLAMVVCCSVVTGASDNNGVLAELIERIITERMLQVNSCNIELIQALVLYHSYFQPENEHRLPVYLLLAQCLAVATDNLGSSDDLHKLSTIPLSDPKSFDSRIRIQTCLALRICLVATALHTSRHFLMKMMPDSTKMCETLLAHGTDLDKLNVYLVTLMEMGREFNTSTAIDLEDLANRRAKLDGIYAGAQSVSLKSPNFADLWNSFKTCYNLISLSMVENVANRLAYHNAQYAATNSTKNSGATAISNITPLVAEILYLSRSLIDSFIALKGKIIPRFMYYRPLFAVTSMIRARMLLWATNTTSVAAMDIDIEYQFQRIKDAWKSAKMSSVTGQRMHEQLDKIERWMELQLRQPAAVCVDTTPSNELLQRIIRGILHDSTPEKDTNITEVIQESTQDPVVVDRLLRELFADLNGPELKH